MGRVFSAYGTPLMAVPLFNYLGRTLFYSEDDWTVVEQNLWRERGNWGQLVNMLGREGEDRIKSGIFYVAVVQLVIIFWSET